MEPDSANQSHPFVKQLARYGPEIQRLRDTVDQILASGARASLASEEIVVFPLLVSCRDIVEDILFAVKDGFGRAALRSVRTLYECVVFARFVHLHPEKATSYLEKFYEQWARTIQNIPLQFRPTWIHSALASKIPKYAAGKMVGTNYVKWTSEHTLEMAKTVGLSNLHPFAFDYPSAYIHPSAVFLLSNIFRSTSEEGAFRVGEASQEPEAIVALHIAHDLILNALDLRLKYSPSEDKQAMHEQCKHDYAQIWGYPPVSLSTAQS